MEVKINVANPSDGKTVTLVVADNKPLHGVKIGDTFKGELIDKTGYVFRMTGGSDNAGFPMRKDVGGSGLKKILLAGGVGFRPKRSGIRRRKSVAGNTVGPKTAQINCVIEKAGKEPLLAVPEAAGGETEDGGEQKE